VWSSTSVRASAHQAAISSLSGSWLSWLGEYQPSDAGPSRLPS